MRERKNRIGEENNYWENKRKIRRLCVGRDDNYSLEGHFVKKDNIDYMYRELVGGARFWGNTIYYYQEVRSRVLNLLRGEKEKCV
mmetsp:Transcript_2952/g.4422  ORF Transcript_2952/g.4422 Transcript_2952/m.4422 type:complete len:85 (-) Transcript_2952:114-368(-)